MFNGDIEGAKTIRDCITDPNDREVIFLNAELLLREGKEQEATTYLSEKAETEEEDAALFAYDTATLFLDYGYLEQAAQWGQRALDMEPDNEKFFEVQGRPPHLFQPSERSHRDIKKFVEHQTYNLNAWHSLGEAYFVCEDFPRPWKRLILHWP